MTFLEHLVICSKKLDLETISSFSYCQDLHWAKDISNYWRDIFSILVEINHLYFLVCRCYVASI